MMFNATPWQFAQPGGFGNVPGPYGQGIGGQPGYSQLNGRWASQGCHRSWRHASRRKSVRERARAVPGRDGPRVLAVRFPVHGPARPATVRPRDRPARHHRAARAVRPGAGLVAWSAAVRRLGRSAGCLRAARAGKSRKLPAVSGRATGELRRLTGIPGTTRRTARACPPRRSPGDGHFQRRRPMVEENTKSPGALPSAARVVVQGERQFIIAPRRGSEAISAELRPLTAGAVRSVVEQVSDLEIVRVLRRRRGVSGFR